MELYEVQIEGSTAAYQLVAADGETFFDVAGVLVDVLPVTYTYRSWVDAPTDWAYAEYVAWIQAGRPPIVKTAGPRMPITRLAFMRRFPTEKRIAIREAAKTDPVLNDAMALLDLAQDVDLDDVDTRRLVSYLQALGLITADDVAVILG
jgi:hypothetical protein